MTSRASTDRDLAANLVRFLDDDIEEFTRNGGCLSQTATSDMPWYCLPLSVIDALSRSGTAIDSYFSRRQAQIEQLFTRLCTRHHAIGFVQRRPIVCTPLNERPPSKLPANWRAKALFGGNAADLKAIEIGFDRSSQTAVTVKGYAGYLMTDPTFLGEVDVLRNAWNNLPEKQKPRFPLGRFLSVRSMEVEVITFGNSLGGFFKRWGLISLATWDIPCPQGPLMPNPWPADSPARPNHGIHMYVPNYYRPQRDDTLLRDIENLQQQHARDEGLDPAAVSMRHPEAYARMLDVLHLERAILSRFPDGTPTGLITRLETAVCENLGLSIDHIRRYRKNIQRCRRGERSSIKWLNKRS